jgi:lipoprotein NlpD
MKRSLHRAMSLGEINKDVNVLMPIRAPRAVEHAKQMGDCETVRWRGHGMAAIVVIGLALAACAAPNSPAPVVNRTTPPSAGVPVRPAVPPPATRPTPPAQTTNQPAGEAGVQTVPVRPSGVESRPLGPTAGPPNPTPAAGANAIKSGPRGTKRPFSDQAFDDMKAADTTASGVVPSVAGVPAPVPAPVPVPGATPPSAGAPVSPSATPAPATTPSPSAPSTPAAGADKAPEFAWPSSGKVIQGFAEPRSLGLSIDGRPGDAVNAAADGRVIFSGPGPRGYGNLVIVKHEGDLVSVYAHNRSLLVKEGQTVKRGQRIAELGDSGTDRPKLHFEIRKQGKPVDPARLLPKRG